MVAKRKSFEGYGPVQRIDADRDGAFITNADGDVEPVLVDVTGEPVHTPTLPKQSESSISSPSDISEIPIVADGNASVGIVDRWEGIDASLKSLAEASKHNGIVTISESDSPVRRSQQSRYGSDYWPMVERSRELISDEEVEAKEAFARAFGAKAMVASGLWSEEKAKQEQDDAYKKFKGRYGGSDSAKTNPKNPRAKYRRKIKKGLKKYDNGAQ